MKKLSTLCFGATVFFIPTAAFAHGDPTGLVYFAVGFFLVVGVLAAALAAAVILSFRKKQKAVASAPKRFGFFRGAFVTVCLVAALPALIIAVIALCLAGAWTFQKLSEIPDEVAAMITRRSPYAELTDAVQRGNTAAVRALLAQNEGMLRPGARSRGFAHLEKHFQRARRDALCLAATKKNLGILNLLLEEGADPNVPCGLAYDLLGQVLQSGDRKSLDALIEHGANFRENPCERFKAAAFSNNVEMLDHLAELGLQLTSACFLEVLSSQFQFHTVERGVFEFAARQGVDFNAQNPRLGTPLSMAAQYGNRALIQFLFDHGARIHTRFTFTSGQAHPLLEEALWECCLKPSSFRAANCFERARLLIDRGADINEQANRWDADIPLGHLFVSEDAGLRCFQFLVENGYDFSVKHNGQTLVETLKEKNSWQRGESGIILDYLKENISKPSETNESIP